MTIRTFQPSDVPEIVSLVSRILEVEFPQDRPAYPPEDLQELSKVYGGNGSTFLVAEDQGKIVGTCGIKAEGTKTAVLRRLFVDPGCRSKGIGAGLLKRAVEVCRSGGFREVVIRTSTAMEKAIRLCTDLGFQEEGRWTLGPTTLVRFRLRLALGETPPRASAQRLA